MAKPALVSTAGCRKNGMGGGAANDEERSGEHPGLYALGGVRITGRRTDRLVDRPGRRGGDRADVDARFQGPHPLCHGGLAGLGDRHLVRRGGGLRQGGLCQSSHRHVPGGSHGRRGPGRGLAGPPGADLGDRRDLRRGVARLGRLFPPAAGRAARHQRPARSAGRLAGHERQLSHPTGSAVLLRLPRAAGIRPDGGGRGPFGPVGDRLRRR